MDNLEKNIDKDEYSDEELELDIGKWLHVFPNHFYLASAVRWSLAHT